jgi:hypothetical protein
VPRALAPALSRSWPSAIPKRCLTVSRSCADIAPRARARGDAILSASAHDDRGRDRDQRQASVAAFTRQIWASLGGEAASIGTIGLVTPREETDGC